MTKTLAGRKRIRKSFGRIPEIITMPNLIEMQKNSYDQFLQIHIKPENRQDIGLQEVFKSVFPIHDFAGKSELQFVNYEFDEPKYDVDECQQRGMTFASPLKATLRLIVWDIEEETGARSIRDIKEQEVYMGDMPLMTNKGTFIVNGTERVIVSQMHRSPGVFFDHDGGKTHASGKYLFGARVIPYRGSWLDLEFDAKDTLFVRIDRRRKLPMTTFLMALWNDKVDQLVAKGKTPDEQQIRFGGMTPEQILQTFYEQVTYVHNKKKGWQTPFNPTRLKGIKLTHDFINAANGEVLVEAGTKITPRVLKKLEESGVKNQLVTVTELVGKYAGADIINEKTGEIYVEAGDELTEELVSKLEKNGLQEISVLAIDHINVGPYLRNTLYADRNRTREDALLDIYRVMRPGEPPTVDAANVLFNGLFFDSERSFVGSRPC